MGLNRRTFLGTSAAAVAVAGTMVRGQVFGANDRVGVCVCGVNGRGTSHIEGFSETNGSEVLALCDPDANVLASRAKQFESKYGKKVKTYRDVREALSDDSIDAISIATPNHWHSLMAIWGVQAGKDVYVEKPLSHNVWEGRQLAAIEADSDRIVMHGTQSRSSTTWMRDIKLLQDGFIGKMHKAKGFTYKTGNRVPIGYGVASPAPEHLDWNLWQGPAEDGPYLARKDSSRGLVVHYNWHWVWRYGNGEIGNQGVHQMDLCSWAMNKGLPVKVYSAGGRYKWEDDAETPNTQVAIYTYADGTIMEFEVRNMGSYAEEGSLETGNTYLCADGYYVEDKGFFDYRHKAIEVKAEKPESKGTWGNFIAAVQSRDKKLIRGTALEGHISSAHCHLGNVAYQLGRSLEFDPKTERFVNDDEANKLLTRPYRDEFKVPAIVAG